MAHNKPVDVNNPAQWKRYSPEKCSGCWAGCCTMPVEVRASDLVNLGIADEYEIEADPRIVARDLQKQGLIKSYREKTELFMLASKSNGDCIFLTEKRLCSVFEKRPQVCRDFPEKTGIRIGYCPAAPHKV